MGKWMQGGIVDIATRSGNLASVDLMSTQDASEFFGVTIRCVRQWIEAGDLKATRIGKQWLIAGCTARAFKAKRTKAPT